MFTYLQKLLGKSMKYYEVLMQSKSEAATITQKDIDRVYKELKPLELDAVVYYENREVYNIDTFSLIKENPVNKKGDPLLFKGNFILQNQLLSLFIDDKRPLSDVKRYRLLVKSIDDRHVETKRILEIQKNNFCRSLPIWEEVIHRFPYIHKLIVSINNKHPWTLYKKATEFLKKNDYTLYLGGYPQWRINNIDFRKIKELAFLMEYRQNDTNTSVYFFLNKNSKSIEIFIQKT